MRAKINNIAEGELPQIATLAGEIWRAHYPGIISNEQIDYMLSRMFDLDEMKRQIAQGTTYAGLNCAGELVGFASYAPTSTIHEFKLDKLYVHERVRGRGYGRQLLEHVIENVQKHGGRSLILAANKKNSAAIAMYERNGFQIRESVVNDIGNGFVMDDFVMAREV